MPSLDSGFVALRTSGSALSALTVSSIGVLNFEAVIFSPSGARSTTGLIPFAWEGNRCSRRFVAALLSVPGSVRLSLTFGPSERANTASTANTSSHPASTIQRRRTQIRPRRYNPPVISSPFSRSTRSRRWRGSSA